MAKQPEHTRTLELKLSSRPGRPPKFENAAAKQKAYRERRKAAGKPSDTRDETVARLTAEVKALRATNDMQALETVQPKESAFVGGRTHERNVSALESKVQDLEFALKAAKTRRGAELEELLIALKSPKRDFEAIFLTRYDGTRIQFGYEADKAVKLADSLGRLSSRAATEIDSVQKALQQSKMLSTEEIAVLNAAQRILGSISHDVTKSKDWVRSVGTRIHKDEAARGCAASNAVAREFPGVFRAGSDEMWLWGVATGVIHDVASMTKSLSQLRQTRTDYESWLSWAQKDIVESLEYRVRTGLSKGKTADEILGEMKQWVEARLLTLTKSAVEAKLLYQTRYETAVE